MCSLTVPASSLAQGIPRRTLFDEERELNEKARNVKAEERLAAIRTAFDAVEKAAKQLDDLQSLVEEGDWGGVRQFVRLFNNSVEREGMEELSSKLTEKADRKAALAVSRELTNKLKSIDRCAQQKDTSNALLLVDEARGILAGFQSFKP